MKMTQYQPSIKILLFFIILACYVGSITHAYANLYFSPVILKAKAQKINADLEDIIISLDTNETQLGNVSFDRDSFRFAFLSALQESVVRSAIFDDSSKRKIALFVQVRKLSVHDREIIISYELIDKNTGKTFYLQYFVTTPERNRTTRAKAVIQSVEANLRNFMESLNPAIFNPKEEKPAAAGKVFSSGLFGSGNNDSADDENLTRKAVKPAKSSDEADDGDGESFWKSLIK